MRIILVTFMKNYITKFCTNAEIDRVLHNVNPQSQPVGFFPPLVTLVGFFPPLVTLDAFNSPCRCP